MTDLITIVFFCYFIGWLAGFCTAKAHSLLTARRAAVIPPIDPASQRRQRVRDLYPE